MKFYVYGKEGCKYCEKAVELLEATPGIKYGYIDIVHSQITREDLSKLAGGKDIRKVPQIFDGNRYIGGFQALENYLASMSKK